MQAELLSSHEVTAIRGAYRATFERVSAALAEAAEQQIDRLPPQRWLLEWGLPLWLGECFGLKDEPALTLAVCNLLGLTYVRIQDDLADGELPAPNGPLTMALAAVAFQQAIVYYARLLGSDERFWAALELRLNQWSQAMMASPNLPPGFGAQPDLPALRRLAYAGAPVHIGLVAACLLSHHEGDLARLGAALEDWLLANVLLDHARDWAADLEAGRYNYFIAHSTPIEQSPAQSAAIRQRMLEMTYLDDGGQSYFDLIEELLQRARSAALPAGCARLNAYLDWFADQVRRDLEDHRQQAIDQLRSATRLLFGAT